MIIELIKKNMPVSAINIFGIYSRNSRNSKQKETIEITRVNKMPFIVAFKYAMIFFGVMATYGGIRFLLEKKRKDIARRTAARIKREESNKANKESNREYKGSKIRCENTYLKINERLSTIDVMKAEASRISAENKIEIINIAFDGIKARIKHIAQLRGSNAVLEKITQLNFDANLLFKQYSEAPSLSLAKKINKSIDSLRLSFNDFFLIAFNSTIITPIVEDIEITYGYISDILKNLEQHQVELNAMLALRTKLNSVIQSFIEELEHSSTEDNSYLFSKKQFSNSLNKWFIKDLSRVTTEIIQARVKWKHFSMQKNISEDAGVVLSSIAYARVVGAKVFLNIAPKSDRTFNRIKEYINKEEEQFKTFIKLIIVWSKERWTAQGHLVLNFKESIAERLWLWCLPTSLQERQQKLTELLDLSSRSKALDWFKSYFESSLFVNNKTFCFNDEELLKAAGLERLEKQVLSASEESNICENLTEVDEELICPLTRCPIKSPVKIGPHLYEQASALNWYLIKNTDPLTREPIELDSLNIDLPALKKQQHYLTSHSLVKSVTKEYKS